MKNIILFVITLHVTLSIFSQSVEMQMPLLGGSIKPINTTFPVEVTFPSNSYSAINLLGANIKHSNYESVTVKLSSPAQNPLLLLVNDLEPDKVEKAFNTSSEVTLSLSLFKKKEIKNIRLLSLSPQKDATFTITEAFLKKKNGEKESLIASNMNAKPFGSTTATFDVPEKGWETLFRYTTPEFVDKVKGYKRMRLEFLEKLKINLVLEFNTEIDGRVNVISTIPINSGKTIYTVDLPVDKSYSIVHLLHVNSNDGGQVVSIKGVYLLE